jgi:uncharacterized protein
VALKCCHRDFVAELLSYIEGHAQAPFRKVEVWAFVLRNVIIQTTGNGGIMIEVRELDDEEIEDVLKRVGYGQLAVCDAGQQYVVPIHYAVDSDYIYIYTTEGKKSEILGRNPNICLQVEDVKDNEHWVSVIVYGEAQRLTDEADRADAINAVTKVNPTLTPAVSIHWLDNWVRENIEAVYRIVPLELSGRRSMLRN